MKIDVKYFRGHEEFEIPDDVEFLRVTQMTGDEIVEVYVRDEEWGDPTLWTTLDPNWMSRVRDFFDHSYMVNGSDIEEWNRTRSRETMIGYVSANMLLYGAED